HVDLDLRVDAWRIPGRGRVLGAPAQHDAARPAQRAQVDQPLGEFPVAHAQHHAALIHDDSDAGTVPHSDPARLHVAVAALHLLAQLGHHLPDLVAANRDPAFAPPDPRLLALAVDVDEVVVVGQDDAGHVGPQRPGFACTGRAAHHHARVIGHLDDFAGVGIETDAGPAGPPHGVQLQAAGAD